MHALHAADIKRKHQKPISVLVEPDGVGIISGYVSSMDYRKCEFKNGEIISKIGKGTNANMSIAAIVPCYSEPPFLAGKSVVSVLSDFSGFVEKALKLFN